MLELTGKIAIVTGASRGIGRAIALMLASRGAVVVGAARGENAAGTAADIRAAGGQADVASVDVNDPASVDAMVATTLERHGRVDILVNNAGITRDQLMLRMKRDDWDQVIATNLTSAFGLVQAVLKPMIKQRAGRIISISSVVGQTGNAGQANYAASKAGLIGLTKTIARELASRSITCNAVAPGFITTDMTDVLPDQVKTGVIGNIPMAKFGEPDDIASAVAFLASAEAKYITGQCLTVDGGMVM